MGELGEIAGPILRRITFPISDSKLTPKARNGRRCNVVTGAIGNFVELFYLPSVHRDTN